MSQLISLSYVFLALAAASPFVNETSFVTPEGASFSTDALLATLRLLSRMTLDNANMISLFFVMGIPAMLHFAASFAQRR